MEIITEPIFVVGSPRSGTSVLTWCLGQHPNILPVEESNWFAPLALALQTCYEIGSRRQELSQLSAMGISREHLMRSVGDAVNYLLRSQWRAYAEKNPERATANLAGPDEYLRRAASIEDPKGRWVDGTPEYALHIYELLTLFPRSKIIHILRDVRAVVSSLLNFSNLAGYRLVQTEQEAYEYWRRTVNASVAAERAFGSRVVLRIRYDDLVKDPEASLRRCLEFAGEPFHADCLIPLRVKRNSSRVPADFDASDPRTDQKLKSESRELSEELLSETPVAYPGSAELQRQLEEKFVRRARFHDWAPTELSRRIAEEQHNEAS